MSFDFDDVMEVLKIVKQCEDAELHIDTGEMQLSIVKGDAIDSGRSLVSFGGSTASEQSAPDPIQSAPAAQPAATAAPSPAPVVAQAAAPAAKHADASEEGLVPVKASVTSVFYRSPSPDEPSFVEVGDQVEEDTIICLLEVMKCFRQVLAEVRGRVEKVCVENNDMVEEGTVLFLVRPE